MLVTTGSLGNVFISRGNLNVSVPGNIGQTAGTSINVTSATITVTISNGTINLAAAKVFNVAITLANTRPGAIALTGYKGSLFRGNIAVAAGSLAVATTAGDTAQVAGTAIVGGPAAFTAANGAITIITSAAADVALTNNKALRLGNAAVSSDYLTVIANAGTIS